jgi:hypothetical protein
VGETSTAAGGEGGVGAQVVGCGTTAAASSEAAATVGGGGDKDIAALALSAGTGEAGGWEGTWLVTSDRVDINVCAGVVESGSPEGLVQITGRLTLGSFKVNEE